MRRRNHLARERLEPIRRQGMDCRRRKWFRFRARNHHHETAEFAMPFPFQAKGAEIRAVMIGPWCWRWNRKALRQRTKRSPRCIARLIRYRQQRDLRNATWGEKHLRRARMYLIIELHALGIGWGEHVIEAHAAAPVTFCARQDHSFSSVSATRCGASSCAK